MGSGRAAAVTTRPSRCSTPWPVAAHGCGFSTRTWPARSTPSIMIVFSRRWDVPGARDDRRLAEGRGGRGRVGFTPTTQGVPQGGVISPLILNIALHGLEEAAGVRYRGGVHADDVVPGSPAVTRYADDLVACCQTRQQAEQVKAWLAAWLAPRGLAFNEAKTRIVHLTEGLDFLAATRGRTARVSALIGGPTMMAA